MKFRTLTLAAALLAKKVASVTMENGDYTFVGSYEAETNLGRFLGGGSIVGDTLLIMVQAEKSDAFLASVPVQRNSTTGRINGFDFASADKTVLNEKYLTQLSQTPSFVGETYVYSTTSWTMGFADKTFTDISRIERIDRLGFTDAATGDKFYGAYGIDFSPVITDPGTGTGKIMCTSYGSFWEVSLQNNASTNKWEITSATKLADLDAYYTGGFSFIPSGSSKDSVFLASWDDDLVKVMTFDADGRPSGTVSAPDVTDFITGIEKPWGFFFDKQTNDFFVSTWRSSVDGILQFKGFPPGLDVDVVIENIKNEMNVALSILFGRRRELKANKPKPMSVRKGKNSKKKSCGKKCEVEIPSPADIASDILDSADPEEASQVIADVLTETFSNDSFEDAVISGEDSPVFEENIAKVSGAVDLIKEAANSAIIPQESLETVQASLAQVGELLVLLSNVGEGQGAEAL